MPRRLLEGSPEARAAAIAALSARDTAPTAAELGALSECLGDPAKLVQRRAAEAFATLAARGLDVDGTLLGGLGLADLRRRWGAAYALSLAGRLPAAALPTLLEVMGADDGDLRWAAVELVKQLARTHRGAVVDRLLASAREAGVERKMSLYCLRDLLVAAAYDVGVQALADERIEVRLAAVSLIATLDPAAASTRIAALIDDADPRMQRAAAGTLGRLGIASDAVRAALRGAETSSDPSLRRAASDALRRLQPQN